MFNHDGSYDTETTPHFKTEVLHEGHLRFYGLFTTWRDAEQAGEKAEGYDRYRVTDVRKPTRYYERLTWRGRQQLTMVEIIEESKLDRWVETK